MSRLRHSSMILLLAALGMAVGVPQMFAQVQNQGMAQQQMAPANQAPGICGNQPLCYDTPDFAALVMSFRTSNYNQSLKVIDIVMRFQNKTNQPLSLGYVNGSGMATDDRGNRLVVGGQNAYRGIGLVSGGNFDPRFTVRPGGYGDAQFELIQQGYPKVVGFNYVLDLTVSEINSYAGDQHTLGGEFPIQFQGLANGVGMNGGGAQPAYVDNSGGAPATGAPADGTQATTASATGTGSNPCTAAGNGAMGQAAGKATSRISSAASTFSSFGSLFGKKAAANATQVASAAGNCDPNAMSTGSSNTAVPTTYGTTTTPASATQTATTPGVAAPVANSVLQTGATTPATTMAPVQPATAYRTGVRTAVMPGAKGATVSAVQQRRITTPTGQQVVQTRTATRVVRPAANTTTAQTQKAAVTKTTVTRTVVPAKKPATAAKTTTTTGTGR